VDSNPNSNPSRYERKCEWVFFFLNTVYCYQLIRILFFLNRAGITILRRVHFRCISGRVVRCRMSWVGWVQMPSTAAVYQRQLSVPSPRGRLMSTSESWGVNGHTTRYTSPVSVVLRLRLVSGWGLQEMVVADQSRPMGPWCSGKTLLFNFISYISTAHLAAHRMLFSPYSCNC